MAASCCFRGRDRLGGRVLPARGLLARGFGRGELVLGQASSFLLASKAAIAPLAFAAAALAGLAKSVAWRAARNRSAAKAVRASLFP